MNIGMEMTSSSEFYQDSGFSESCLPQTMMMASKNPDYATDIKNLYPEDWPTNDCVFASIFPDAKPLIERYHDGVGGKLIELTDGKTIKQIDSDARSLLEIAVANHNNTEIPPNLIGYTRKTFGFQLFLVNL